jgi:EpsI family protein
MKAAAEVSTTDTVPFAFSIGVGVLVLLAATFYAPVLPPLVREWYEHENFSYGFLIPVIAAYLVFEQRSVLKRQAVLPEVWGVVLLLGSLAVGLLGNALGEPFLSRVSMVATVFSLVYVTAGRRIVSRLAFPLGYLLLMVPPPYVIVKEASYYLKMFDAVVATAALQLIGIPIYRDSYFLHLPNITLEVADVCSGVASLFAMIALGTIYARFLSARLGAKLSVLAGALIFPLVANLFRIFLVGVSVYHIGPVMLGAFFHKFTGTFTFLLSLGMLMLWGEALRRQFPAMEQSNDYNPDVTVGGNSPGYLRQAAVLMPIALAVLVLALALFLSHSMAGTKGVGLPSVLEGLPKQLGPYQDAAISWRDRYRDPQAESSLSRIYQAPNQVPIELFVGYRGAQYAEQRLVSPKLIFPEGWEYAAMDEIRIDTGGGESVDAVWLLTRKGEARRVVLYWYQVDDKTFSSDFRHRMELAHRLLVKSRTDGSVIRLASDVSGYESTDQSLDRVKDFAILLQPELRKLLPAN